MLNEKKILLVEDNTDDVELTLRAFRKNDFLNEIIVKNDGENALDFFFGEDGVADDKAAFPFLILLDLKLPKINGFEVLKKLRADDRTKYIPVVILTSSNEHSDLITGYNLGCNSYIRKPVRFNEFMDAVRQLGAYWLGMNELPFSLN